jgi:hypothetical protein
MTLQSKALTNLPNVDNGDNHSIEMGWGHANTSKAASVNCGSHCLGCCNNESLSTSSGTSGSCTACTHYTSHESHDSRVIVTVTGPAAPVQYYRGVVVLASSSSSTSQLGSSLVTPSGQYWSLVLVPLVLVLVVLVPAPGSEVVKYGSGNTRTAELASTASSVSTVLVV